MNETTVAQKRERILNGLESIYGNGCQDENIIDALTDILHVIGGREGEDWDYILGAAEMHYEAEKA